MGDASGDCVFVDLVLPSGSTVSFHNFKSQNFKLSVSNPTNKYVADLSVLSQISNCQGLGRKNKFEILKTYRTRANGHCISGFPDIYSAVILNQLFSSMLGKAVVKAMVSSLLACQTLQMPGNIFVETLSLT